MSIVTAKKTPPAASAKVRTRERAGTPVAPQASAVALTVTVPLDGGLAAQVRGGGIVVRTIGADVLLVESGAAAG